MSDLQEDQTDDQAEALEPAPPRRIPCSGFYFDFPIADYHRDPCPDPSLSGSLAGLILQRSPWYASRRHPRLNPSFVEPGATKFDLGNAAHWHLTGRGRELVEVNASDWRTKAAQQARKQARAAGKNAVLIGQNNRAGDMAEAALEALQKYDGRLINDWAEEAGKGEVVAACRIETIVWLRGLIDWLPNHRRRVWDYKTTRASASPVGLDRKMAGDWWPLQAATHERILDELDPANAGRRQHLFLCQECDEPYDITVSEVSEGAMHVGRNQLNEALLMWGECMATGVWPGYPRRILRPMFPSWADDAWRTPEHYDEPESERGGIPSDILSAG